MKYVIGVDEVGRGPLAGPVAVGAFISTPEVLEKIGRVNDSKALSSRSREEWLFKILALQSQRKCHYSVTYVPAGSIDSMGIALAIRFALMESLAKLHCDPLECLVLLDGGLRAPKKFLHQKTIIKGDATETAIALASIAAKVHRDRHMIRLAKRYPAYGFEKHKGYGTRIHREALLELGPTELHRRSFIANILPSA